MELNHVKMSHKKAIDIFHHNGLLCKHRKNKYINEWITTQKTMECKLIQ